MKCLLLATALMAAVAVAVPHVVTEFSIPLGHTPSTPAAEFLVKDLYMVVTNSGLVAVNLTSKAEQWFAKMDNAPTALYAGATMAVTINTVDTKGIDIATGKIMWTQDKFFTFSTAKHIKFAVSGSEIAIVTPNKVGALDLTTGKVIFNKDVQSAVSANGQLYYINEDNKLVSEDIFKGTQSWTSNAATSFQDVLYADSNYVVATRAASGSEANTELYVVKAASGDRQIMVQAMNGINEDNGAITIVGTNLSCVAGLEYQRQYIIDITTGYILKEVPYTGGGGSNGASGEHSVITGHNTEIKVVVTPTAPAAAHGTGFEISTGPIGGPYTVACAQTPSSSYQTTQTDNVQYFGDGLFKVGNLQGWVMFYIDAKTNVCTTLTLNEKLPNWIPASSGGKVTKFAGDFVEVEGDNVIGYKVVQ